MPRRPELRSFADLTAADFTRQPVWIGCHTADYDEPWYEDTDEETFRAHTGHVPVDPREGIYLVAAVAVLADRVELPGFLTPGTGAPDPGEMQPHLFVGDAMFGFWGGIIGVPEPRRNALYTALGKTPDDIFPVQFFALPRLTSGTADIVIPDWLSRTL